MEADWRDGAGVLDPLPTPPKHAGGVQVCTHWSRLGAHTRKGLVLGTVPCSLAPVALDRVMAHPGCQHETLWDVSANTGIPDPDLRGNRSAGMQSQCFKSGDPFPAPTKPFKMSSISVRQQPSRKYMAPALAL